jgi:hypothetical protein
MDPDKVRSRLTVVREDSVNPNRLICVLPMNQGETTFVRNAVYMCVVRGCVDVNGYTMYAETRSLPKDSNAGLTGIHMKYHRLIVPPWLAAVPVTVPFTSSMCKSRTKDPPVVSSVRKPARTTNICDSSASHGVASDGAESSEDIPTLETFLRKNSLMKWPVVIAFCGLRCIFGESTVPQALLTYAPQPAMVIPNEW